MSALASRTGLVYATSNNETAEATLLALYDFVAQRMAAGTPGAGVATAAELKLARKSLGLGAGADIPSAATLDLTGRTGWLLNITGTNAISALTMDNDDVVLWVAAAALPLTYHATNMPLPGGQSYVCTAGDWGIFAKDNGGVFRIVIFKKDGTSVISNAIAGSFKNLVLSAAGLAATVAVTCDELLLTDGAGIVAIERSISGTITTTATGAGGLDTGALATNTGYYVFRIGKTDGTRAFLFSLSATSPTMPSDYTLKARIGWFKTDGTANKYPLSFKQVGRRGQYVCASGSNLTAYTTIIANTQGNPTTPTWIPVDVSAYIPGTATMIKLLGYMTTANATIVAPNNTFGAVNATTNPPENITNVGSRTFELMLESSNVYYASNSASSGLQVVGWEDNL